MNVGYAVAVAILDGAAMVQQFAPQRIERDDVWALIPKIMAHHDPELDQAGPAARNTRMVVRLNGGTKLEHFVEMARTIGRPLTNDEVARKYRTLTDGIVDPKRQAAVEDRVMNLEKLADVGELAALLGPEVGAAFN